MLVSKTRSLMKWRYRKKNTSCNSKCLALCKNVFAELEYIASSGTNTAEVAQVHNLVGTSRIVSQLRNLDLRAISHLIPNAKFEKQKFAAITIRLGQPVCTVLLFTSGKMVLTGCKSMLDCILASTSVYYYLRSGFPGVRFVLEPVKIQNIVGNALLSLPAGCHLDLLRFYEMYNIYCTYQPSMFPGLIYRQSDLPIVLLIFYSGKVVITRAKCMLDVYEGWGKVLKLLQNFVTESDTDKNNMSAAPQLQLNACP